MTLKKWFFLFWSTIAIGAAVSMVGGLIMLLTDQEFGFLGIKATGFNLLMMFLAGATIGAFSHMGFFSYLTLNYIALSVFRKKYLWNALQGYTTLFAVFLLGYLLYEGRTNNLFYWMLPLGLLLFSLVAAWLKVKQTNKSAFIPTMFLMFVITAIEGYPALQGDNNVATVLFMLLPLFACNYYQNYQMAKLTTTEKADSAKLSAKTAL